MDSSGRYDPVARPPKFVQYRHHFLSTKPRIRVDHDPMPLHFALGLRENLRAALRQLEREIIEAGAELPP